MSFQIIRRYNKKAIVLAEIENYDLAKELMYIQKSSEQDFGYTQSHFLIDEATSDKPLSYAGSQVKNRIEMLGVGARNSHKTQREFLSCEAP